MQIPLLTWGPSESPADLTGLSHPGGGEQAHEAIAFSALLLAVQAHLCDMSGMPEPADAPGDAPPEGAQDEDERGDGETPAAGLIAAGAAALPILEPAQVDKPGAPAPAAAPVEPAAVTGAGHAPAAQTAPQRVSGGTQDTPPSRSVDESAQAANATRGADTADLHRAAQAEPAAERRQAGTQATPSDGSAPAARARDAARSAAPSSAAASVPAKSAPRPRAAEPPHRQADTAVPPEKADAWAAVRGLNRGQAAADAQGDKPDAPESGVGGKAPGRRDSEGHLSFNEPVSPAIREAAAEANPADRLIARHEPIVEQVLYKLDFQALRRGGTLHIALEPDALGGVTIRLEASPEGVLVHIEADSAQVREALDSQLGQLTATLRDCGITAQAIRVQPGGAHEPAAAMQADTLPSGDRSRQHGNARRSSSRSPETTADTAPKPGAQAARRVTGINLYA
jgi:flagellar hook-length control protein FliK